MAITTSYGWSFFGGFNPPLNNIEYAGNQFDPSVTALGNGSYFATWTDPGEVQGRFVDANGDAIGNEFTVNTPAPGQQIDSDVAALLNGNVVVTFTDYAGTAGFMRVRILASNGSPIRSDFVLSDPTIAVIETSVATLSDGRFAVSYTVDPGGGQHWVGATTFYPDGESTNTFLAVSSGSPTRRSDHSSVTGLAGGGFVVVFTDQPSAGGETDVRFQRYNADENRLDGFNGALIDSGGQTNIDPQVTSLQDGGFAVAYTTNQFNGTLDIAARVFNADGTPRSNFIYVNNLLGGVTAGTQDSPTITTLSNGYFVIAWSRGDGATAIQAFDQNGNAIGTIDAFFPNTLVPEIAGLASGHVAAVVHTSTPDEGGDNSIRSGILQLSRGLTSDGASDTLNGDSLRDILIGNGGNDGLNGADGADELTGGAGNDAVDGGPGFDIAHHSGTRSNYTIQRNLDGSITTTDIRSGSPDGTDTLTGVERLRFSNTTIAVAPTHDYRGDYHGDILWRDTTTGQVSVWNLLGAAFNGSTVLGGIGSNIQIAGNGDFNGDGTSDVLLRDRNTGSITDWTVSNGQFVASFVLGGVGANVDVVGAGDFNGDGVSDVLLRDRTTGGVSDWQLNANDSFNSSHQLGGISSNVDVVGAGDFNGDGVSDVLLRDRSTGVVSFWQINADNSFNSSHTIGGVPANLDVIGAADFNGDGFSDILLRNRGTGEVSYWAVVNNAFSSSTQLGGVPGNYQVAGARDVDGNGFADVLLRDTSTGAVGAFVVNNGAFVSFVSIGGAGLNVQFAG